mmetsp:Transcript_6431/g.13488  ORF Transcript_6431/g.13488 Transcript_6431/m.13488 type:complete len:245 (-) Transcript_6431:329-1063(-)
MPGGVASRSCGNTTACRSPIARGDGCRITDRIWLHVVSVAHEVKRPHSGVNVSHSRQYIQQRAESVHVRQHGAEATHLSPPGAGTGRQSQCAVETVGVLGGGAHLEDGGGVADPDGVVPAARVHRGVHEAGGELDALREEGIRAVPVRKADAGGGEKQIDSLASTAGASQFADALRQLPLLEGIGGVTGTARPAIMPSSSSDGGRGRRGAEYEQWPGGGQPAALGRRAGHVPPKRGHGFRKRVA